MAERSTGKGLDSLRKGPDDQEIQAVKDVIASFLIALKNCALYPENHAIWQNSVANANTRLDSFFKSYDSLRLDVEEDRLLYQGNVVHQGTAEGENLPFLLFRDGIQWLEFQRGVETSEVRGVIRILNRYRELQDEAEGDLVTALWESDFPNLRYKAADICWEAESLLDLSLLSAGQVAEAVIRHQEEEQVVSTTLAPQRAEQPIEKLLPEEVKALQRMILEEEKRDRAQDLLEVVLVILSTARKKEDVVAVLGFLEEEFPDALEQGEFRFTLKLMRGLDKIYQIYKDRKSWALPLLDDFFMKLSNPEVLGVLSQVLPTLDMLDTDQMEALREVLLRLSPEAILALGPMLAEIGSLPIQEQILEIIRILAERDLRPLERLLDLSEVFVVQRLISILGQLSGKKPTQILLRMIHHASERVRRQAVKHLLARDKQLLKRLFHLIEDSSDSVRRLILQNLGQGRSELAEGLLLDYLEGHRFKITDYQHLLACYNALGRCGSSRSIPFLQKALFDGGWIPGLAGSVHRQGAVAALMALGREEADKILQKASRSLFPGVRLAYRKAIGATQ